VKRFGHVLVAELTKIRTVRSARWALLLALAILLPLPLLDSQGLGNVPVLRTVVDYLPDQAGAVIMHLSGPAGTRFGRPYGAWAGLAIMLAWTAAALAAGYLTLSRTDVAGTRRRGMRPRTAQ
jgi:hypothetical protein